LKRDKKIHLKRIKRDIFDPIEKGLFLTAIEKRFKDIFWIPIDKN
jgi:hypothetical protein